MAATLGADAFSLATGRWAAGVGDQLEPIDLDLSGYFLLLVRQMSVSTTVAIQWSPLLHRVSIRDRSSTGKRMKRVLKMILSLSLRALIIARSTAALIWVRSTPL